MDDTPMACSCHQIGGRKIHNYYSLETMLPVEYNYLVCTYTESSNQSITCRFHLNCLTKDEALEWLEKCSSINRIAFEIVKRDDNTIYARCSCMRNNTPCKTAIEINFNLNVTTNESSINEHQNTLREHPMTVNLHYTHEFEDVSDMLIDIEEVDVKDLYDWNNDDDDYDPFALLQKPRPTMLNRFVQDKLYVLFDRDCTPEQVYEKCRFDIDNAFVKYNTDETMLPNLKWVYDRFYDYMNHKHGPNAKKELLKVKKRWGTCSFDTLWANRPAKKPTKRDVVEKLPVIDPLQPMIDELCKKYVPILPAAEARDSLPEPTSGAVSGSPAKVSDSTKPSVDKNSTPTPSYILKFSSELDQEKLNLFPLNDMVVRNKLPELKVVQTPNDHLEMIKMIAVDACIPQNMAIPCASIGGLILVANTDHQPLPKPRTNTSKSNSSKPPKEPAPAPAPLPALPRKPKQPRKAALKYEDGDEIFFTDKLEELRAVLDPPKPVSRKPTKRRAAPARLSKRPNKTKRENTPSPKPQKPIKTTKSKSVPARKKSKTKPTRKSARISKNKKKVVPCPAIAGIENIICSD